MCIMGELILIKQLNIEKSALRGGIQIFYGYE